MDVHFGDHLVDFIVALSVGGFSRNLVDLVDSPLGVLLTCRLDFLVDLLVRVSVGCLQVGFGLSVGLDCVETAISLF